MQIAYFRNLIPYFESSLCADQKSYKNHDDPIHPSRAFTLDSYKKRAKTMDVQGLPLFSGSLRTITLEACNRSP